MRVANLLLSKAKAKVVMVLLKSTGSNHCITSFRERTADKKEIIFFDPHIQRECVYKEDRKIRGMKHPIKISNQKNEHTYGVITQELLDKIAEESSTEVPKTPKVPKNKLKSKN